MPHLRKQLYLSAAENLPVIRCPPERILPALSDAYRIQNYTDLAAYALAGAAFFAPECDVRTSLKRAYRAYTDKIHPAQKRDNLRAATLDTMQILRQNAHTELQREKCAHSLLHLADCALRVCVEDAMQAQPDPDEVESETVTGMVT